jgi:predicted TIM-barrel fold metal-dependent hydrolase
MMNRRDVLGLAITAGAGSALLPATSQSKSDDSPPFRIVDTNINLFRWPFRRLPLDEVDLLVRKLRSLRIAQGWAGSFEGLLHRDLAGVNRRLAKACRKHPELTPIGSINPELPGWETDLQRCIDEHAMPGVRLHPNYHGYALDDPRFIGLLERATEAERFVQIASAMEDVRTQHPQARFPDVDLAPLAKAVARIPRARVQILNHRLRSPLLDQLAETSGVYFDTARVDSTDGVPKLVDAVSPGRVLFGTNAPFLIPEAALIRVHESGLLDEAALKAVLAGNADRFSGTLKA